MTVRRGSTTVRLLYIPTSEQHISRVQINMDRTTAEDLAIMLENMSNRSGRLNDLRLCLNAEMIGDPHSRSRVERVAD